MLAFLISTIGTFDISTLNVKHDTAVGYIKMLQLSFKPISIIKNWHYHIVNCAHTKRVIKLQ
jgi:hypothetical protein